jgi:hypothetical protein
MLIAAQRDSYERETKKFDIIVDLFRKCTSTGANDRAFALKFVRTQKQSDPERSLARFNSYLKTDKTFQDALNECQNSMNVVAGTEKDGEGSEPGYPQQVPANLKSEEAKVVSAKPSTEKATVPSSPSAPPNDGARFWIYVGSYTNGVGWKSKYLAIPHDFDPAHFDPGAADQSRTFHTSVPINVRYGSFNADGGFPPISKTIKPNENVTLVSMAQWFDSGDWWATFVPPNYYFNVVIASTQDKSSAEEAAQKANALFKEKGSDLTAVALAPGHTPAWGVYIGQGVEKNAAKALVKRAKKVGYKDAYYVSY